MTRFSLEIHTADDGWNSVALFADTVSFSAMITCANAVYDNGNSISTPCDTAAIIDMETGEIVWDTDDLPSILESGAHIVNDQVTCPPSAWGDYAKDWDFDDDEPGDIDDDCGFDPYLGCYTDDC